MAIVAAGGLLCAAWVTHNLLQVRHLRWVREFDAAQKPNLELNKVRAELDSRIASLERAQQNGQLGKLR